MDNKTFIENLKKQHIKNDKKRFELLKQYNVENIKYKEEKDKKSDNIDELEQQLENL